MCRRYIVFSTPTHKVRCRQKKCGCLGAKGTQGCQGMSCTVRDARGLWGSEDGHVGEWMVWVSITPKWMYMRVVSESPNGVLITLRPYMPVEPRHRNG